MNTLVVDLKVMNQPGNEPTCWNERELHKHLKVSGRHGSIHRKPVHNVGVNLSRNPSFKFSLIYEVTVGCPLRPCDLERVPLTPETQSIHPKTQHSGKSSACLAELP